MTTMETGRVCIVTTGADKGKEVVVKEAIDANFVKIVGRNVKERRINVLHLEPTSRKGEIPTLEIKEKKMKAAAKPADVKPAIKKDTKIVAKILEKAKAEGKEQ